MSQNLLAGRGAVVTGGSRGVGRAVAELLGHLGAGVVVNGRDPDPVQETVAAISASGGRATAMAGAADDERVAAALIDECVTRFGRLDVLINCAGIAEPPRASILDISPAEFDHLIGAHLGTAFHTCRAAAPVMVAQGSGSIVNTSSIAFLGDYGGTGYPAGKGAVNGLTMAIAAELKPSGVRANVVCPGAKTRLSTGADYEEQIKVCTAAAFWTRRPSRSRWTLLPPPLRPRSTRIWPATWQGTSQVKYSSRQGDSSDDSTGQHRGCWHTATIMTPNRGRSGNCTR